MFVNLSRQFLRVGIGNVASFNAAGGISVNQATAANNTATRNGRLANRWHMSWSSYREHCREQCY